MTAVHTEARARASAALPREAREAAWLTCQACGRRPRLRPQDLGVARGNTERFRRAAFRLWKCPECSSIHSLEPVDFDEIYRGYPLAGRREDFFTRAMHASLLRRLRRAGLERGHSLLDYGCSNGLFVRFARGRGYEGAVGFDPYVPELARPPDEPGTFDWVVANDVAEHAADPGALIRECVRWLRPGGRLYLSTPDATGMEMHDVERHLFRLHQPFHRVILSERCLHELLDEAGLEVVGSWRRSYMDTPRPFVNYRFLDELNRAVGHNLDRALDPGAWRVVLRNPRLVFYGLFGSLFGSPSVHELGVLCRKRPQLTTIRVGGR